MRMSLTRHDSETGDRTPRSFGGLQVHPVQDSPDLIAAKLLAVTGAERITVDHPGGSTTTYTRRTSR